MLTRALLACLLVSVAAAATICDFTPEICHIATGEDCPRADQAFFHVQNQSIPWYFYDVLVSSGHVNLDGTVKGRLAGYTLNATSGSKVGTGIHSSDGETPFAVIAYAEVYWPKGTLGPSNEGMFVGDKFHGSSSLARRVTADCPDFEENGGCFGIDQNNIYRFWNTWSGVAARINHTVTASVQSGVLHLSCKSAHQQINVVNVTVSQWNSITDGFSVASGCNADATWLFNIIVTATGQNVNFRSATGFPKSHGKKSIIYNVVEFKQFQVGGIQNVKVSHTVNGNIVAINHKIDQTSGEINGRVIAIDTIKLVEVNRPTCP